MSVSIETMLDQTCDIYHIIERAESPGYYLPESASFEYATSPDANGIACHFCVKANNITVTQKEPQNVMDARIKLILPTKTDVRLNDRIVDCESGLEYTAEQPRNIRNHHIFVYVQRVAEQRFL